MGNIDKIKSAIKGWRLGDYFRQFSIVAAGIIVTFWGSDKVTEHSRQKEVRAAMQLVALTILRATRDDPNISSPSS